MGNLRLLLLVRREHGGVVIVSRLKKDYLQTVDVEFAWRGVSVIGQAMAKTKYRAFSTSQRTIKPSIAPVEMAQLFGEHWSVEEPLADLQR